MTESAAVPAGGGVKPIAPTGYRLILPPGWVRIPLRRGTAEALEDLVFSRLKELPPEVPKDEGMRYRLRVRRAVEEQIVQARKADGLDLYLPVRPRYRAMVAASFLVSEVLVVDDDGQPGPEAVLAQLVSGNGTAVTTSTQELAETLTVRREYIQPPSTEHEVDVATRHVEYALPVPYDPHRYLVVSFSTAGNGDPESDFTKALTELFDAVMSTFRWTGGNNGKSPINKAESSPR